MNLSRYTLEGLYDLLDEINDEIARRKEFGEEEEEAGVPNPYEQATKDFTEAMKLLDYPPEDELPNILMVKGLSMRTSENAVYQRFGQFGTVIEVVIVTNPQTKESEGRAYVVAADPITADKMIRGLNETEFDGRIISVQHLSP